jgi:plasmid stability protein
MANLTITVDDELLKRARIRALDRGTSVNAVLAEYLRVYAGDRDARVQATRALIELAAKNTRAGGSARAKQRGGRRWTRDELHDR